MKSFISLLAVSCLLCSSASALDIAALASAMANPDRPAEDKARDASRKAPQVLDFFGVEPGMTVLDINASTGWYTEVLSYAVGSEGTVLMQNRPGGRAEDAANAKASRLGNIELIGAVSDAAPGSVDFAITALNFHDFHNRDPQVAQGILAQAMAALKPGGILGIIDHEGTPGADNATLHRIAFDEVVRAVTQAGFAVVGVSQVLDNPADDHTLSPSDPSLGRNTDRIVLKLMKL
ncbi:MAG: methyltransferase [Gammaproteobacteria bacterium]|nr:methyltransferase [Gammaproteobacteria bacterium]